MKNIFIAIILIAMLNGCSGEVGTSGTIGTGKVMYGQWTEPRPAGDNQWLTVGWDTNAVMTGADKHCSAMSKSTKIVTLDPHTADKKATLVFGCI